MHKTEKFVPTAYSRPKEYFKALALHIAFESTAIMIVAVITGSYRIAMLAIPLYILLKGLWITFDKSLLRAMYTWQALFVAGTVNGLVIPWSNSIMVVGLWVVMLISTSILFHLASRLFESPKSEDESILRN